MTSKVILNAIKIVKEAINALSIKYPLSIEVTSILARDFKPLQQSDGYAILVYLINACRDKQDLKPIDPEVWKLKDAYSKMSIEKFKTEVLQAVKVLSSMRKENILVLRKSDLVLPYRPQFFNCCKGLTSYALSFQLSLTDPFFQPGCTFETADEVMRYTVSEKDALKSDMEFYSKINEQLESQLEFFRNELNNMNNLKWHVESELNEMINSCKYLNKDALRDKNTRFKALRETSKYTNDLYMENLKKLKSLRALSETLSFLNKSLERKENEPVIIDGKELLANISYETRTYAEKENISLVVNGSFNLQGLFTILVNTLSGFSEKYFPLSHEISRLLDLKLPVYEPNLLERLLKMQLKLKEQVSSLLHAGKRADKSDVENCQKELFPTISSINLELHMESKQNIRDPIVDFKKFEIFISKNKGNRKCNSRSSPIMISNTTSSGFFDARLLKKKRKSFNKILHRLSSNAAASNESASYNNLKQLRRMSSSLSILPSEDSPVSTVKNESTKISESQKYRRRSRSSSNLLSSNTVATNDSPSFSCTRKEHLSSTPKAEFFFEGNKSISPICMQSYYDVIDGRSPQLSQNIHTSQQHHDSSIVSNGTHLLSDLSSYCFSASFVSTSEEDELKSTFNSSKCLPDFSLGSSGILDISISDSINS